VFSVDVFPILTHTDAYRICYLYRSSTLTSLRSFVLRPRMTTPLVPHIPSSVGRCGGISSERSRGSLLFNQPHNLRSIPKYVIVASLPTALGLLHISAIFTESTARAIHTNGDVPCPLKSIVASLRSMEYAFVSVFFSRLLHPRE